MPIPSSILKAFNLEVNHYSAHVIGSGHIHKTYKLSGKPSYILQRVNKNVFTKPEVIASNIKTAADYLKAHNPEYLFLSPVRTQEGNEMEYDMDGYPWRMFPYIENTITIDQVETADEAFNAAHEFAKLTRLLDGVDVNLFRPTIDRFHDLTWRWEQFEQSLNKASDERKNEAASTIRLCQDFYWLVTQYEQLRKTGILTLRVTHNDTKVNNVLFDATTRNTVCAIDLDTLMPGYFIYDVGDMIRTFVSPVNEEEKDLSKVVFRNNIYESLVEGYMDQMGDVLKKEEREHVSFGGMMMTYIMAMRMLTDSLNGDVYYHTTYPGQNLVRASNQFRLLEILDEHFNISNEVR